MSRLSFRSVLPLLLLSGCAGAKATMKARTVAYTAFKQGTPRPLKRSLFRKPDDRENMDEEVIQRVINAPLELEFPARIGVVVLDMPFSRRAYASLTPGDEAPQQLARKLEKSRYFVMVSDVSPYLVRTQSIEALRELAARYRLKYLVVFNRKFEDRSRYNEWGWSWISVLAIPFAPAYTLRTVGLLEATLMDVRTGTFLFTAQVHVEASRWTTPWSTDAKLAKLQLAAGRRASRMLSKKFLQKCRRLIKYTKLEKKQLAAARRRAAKLAALEKVAPAAKPAVAPAVTPTVAPALPARKTVLDAKQR